MSDQKRHLEAVRDDLADISGRLDDAMLDAINRAPAHHKPQLMAAMKGEGTPRFVSTFAVWFSAADEADAAAIEDTLGTLLAEDQAVVRVVASTPSLLPDDGVSQTIIRSAPAPAEASSPAEAAEEFDVAAQWSDIDELAVRQAYNDSAIQSHERRRAANEPRTWVANAAVAVMVGVLLAVLLIGWVF